MTVQNDSHDPHLGHLRRSDTGDIPDVGRLWSMMERIQGSADPAEVFAALADALVPSMCDTASVVVDHTGTSSLSSRGVALDTVVQFRPLRQSPSAVYAVRAVVHATTDGVQEYTVVLTCEWRRRTPSAARLLALELLCRHAALSVVQARLRAVLTDRDLAVQNLQHALASNRTIGAAIGVLMVTRQITQEQAYALLAAESQRINRKVIDLAQDVLYTGELAT